MRRALPLLVVALALPSATAAHPGSALTGYVSTVSALEPNVLGVNALVLGGDDRLRISNYSGKTIVIMGYEGEPYLRFDTTGVYANTLSPAAHLNRFRLPRPLKPGVTDPSAAPRWRRVAPGVTYEWHDHRIHWTGREPQPECGSIRTGFSASSPGACRAGRTARASRSPASSATRRIHRRARKTAARAVGCSAQGLPAALSPRPRW
jgi:hypothetical protein